MSKFLVVFFIVVGVLASWVVADTSISVDGTVISGTFAVGIPQNFSMIVPNTVESFYLLLQVDNFCMVVFNLTELTTFEETDSFRYFTGPNTQSVLYSSNENYDSPAAGPYSLQLISENGTCSFNLSAKSVVPSQFEMNMTGSGSDLLPQQPLFFEWDSYGDQSGFAVTVNNPNNVSCYLRAGWYAPVQYESSNNDATLGALNSSTLLFWGPSGSNFTTAGFFPSYFFPLIVSIEAWIDDVTSCTGFTYQVTPLIPPQIQLDGQAVNIEYDFTGTDYFFSVNSTSDYKVNLQLTDTSTPQCDISVSANSFQSIELVTLTSTAPHAVLTGSAPPEGELAIWDLYSSACNVTLSVVSA